MLVGRKAGRIKKWGGTNKFFFLIKKKKRKKKDGDRDEENKGAAPIMAKRIPRFLC